MTEERVALRPTPELMRLANTGRTMFQKPGVKVGVAPSTTGGAGVEIGGSGTLTGDDLHAFLDAFDKALKLSRTMWRNGDIIEAQRARMFREAIAHRDMAAELERQAEAIQNAGEAEARDHAHLNPEVA